MNDPFKLIGPSVISFSGGRTSGYMLHRILEAHGGTLPDDVKVVFCNTGKERDETLDFVERCSQRWTVPVVWLEYRMNPVGPVVKTTKGGRKTMGWHGWQEVNFATANRSGQPFLDVLTVFAAFRRMNGNMPILPNPVQRFCTGEMKTRTMKRYLLSIGWPLLESSCAVGIRADEPRRLAKLKVQPKSDWAGGEPFAPLGKAGVTEAEVMAFWSRQPFDLQLQQHEGSCDLCFLKSKSKMLALMADRPESANWWIEREKETGVVFRKDRHDYANLLKQASETRLFDGIADDDELSIACHCTD